MDIFYVNIQYFTPSIPTVMTKADFASTYSSVEMTVIIVEGMEIITAKI